MEALARSDTLWSAVSFVLAAVAIGVEGGFEHVSDMGSLLGAVAEQAFRNQWTILASMNGAFPRSVSTKRFHASAQPCRAVRRRASVGLNVLFLLGKLCVWLTFGALRGEEQRWVRQNLIDTPYGQSLLQL